MPRTAANLIEMQIYGCTVRIDVLVHGEGDVQGAVNWVSNALDHYNRHLFKESLKSEEEQLLAVRMLEQFPEELYVPPAVRGRPFGVYPSARPDLIDPEHQWESDHWENPNEDEGDK